MDNHSPWGQSLMAYSEGKSTKAEPKDKGGCSEHT